MATSTLQTIRDKVRLITGRPSSNQITDAQIDHYINTFYIYDLPAQFKSESLRSTWQFTTLANVPVYDFPKNSYISNMPPVFVAGYQIPTTQSRSNFYLLSSYVQFIEDDVAQGTGLTGPYTFTLQNTPIMPGFKPNPPGAYSSSDIIDIEAKDIFWNVLICGEDVNGKTVRLVDDGGGTSATGLGFLYDPEDASTTTANARGTINYTTGDVSITNFASPIALDTSIYAQYLPYNASIPTACIFYQDQVIFWPVPDKAYTVSIEIFKEPTDLLAGTDSPLLHEWWQALAYGAADKIFIDSGDFESSARYRPYLTEQINLIRTRTAIQYSSERAKTPYDSVDSAPQGIGFDQWHRF